MAPLSREHRRPLSFADRSRGEYAIEEGLPRCLRVLEAHGLHSTFFVPGAVMRDHPDQVREIAAHGHELFYPQLGVKLCLMAGGGVQKSIWCF